MELGMGEWVRKVPTNAEEGTKEKKKSCKNEKYESEAGS